MRSHMCRIADAADIQYSDQVLDGHTSIADESIDPAADLIAILSDANILTMRFINAHVDKCSE